MVRIVVDVPAIQQLGTDLASVASEFATANTESETIAGAVGHADLSATVRGFAHDWDDRREKFTEAMKALAEAATAVAQTWKDFDQQGADALNGEGGGAGSPDAPQAV